MFSPPSILLPAALPASLLYRAAVAFRNARLDRGAGVRRLALPVVSVGNLVAGGAGKTPVVLALAERLREAGHRPAVLSRGYGREGEAVAAVVSDGRGLVARGPRTAGDEPWLLAARLPGVPVVVSADRHEAGVIAERMDRDGAARVDLHLLDDGFQHRRLARDFDLVLVDAREGFGNGRLLPAGPLREPLSSLRRADAVLLTRWDEGLDVGGLLRRIGRAAPEVPAFHARLVPDSLRPVGEGWPVETGALRGQRVAAFAGIANPESFRATLEGLGAEIVSMVAFRDHHPFTPEEIREMQGKARSARADFWVTTEKDAVRVPLLPADPPLHALRVRAEFVEWGGLFRAIEEAVRGRRDG